jgi:hypothetical protein
VQIAAVKNYEQKNTATYIKGLHTVALHSLIEASIITITAKM